MILACMRIRNRTSGSESETEREGASKNESERTNGGESDNESDPVQEKKRWLLIVIDRMMLHVNKSIVVCWHRCAISVSPSSTAALDALALHAAWIGFCFSIGFCRSRSSSAFSVAVGVLLVYERLQQMCKCRISLRRGDEVARSSVSGDSKQVCVYVCVVGKQKSLTCYTETNCRPQFIRAAT